MRVTFASGGVELTSGDRRERRAFLKPDGDRLLGCAGRYAGQVRAGLTAGLLDRGRELWQWLDGASHWLSELSAGSGPRQLDLAVADHGTAQGQLPPLTQCFLNAPWELLADPCGTDFLAADPERPLMLSRRLGWPSEPLQPAHADFLLMFMAASPEGSRELDFEREEIGILRATTRLPLHLRVEESGCLRFLAPRLASDGGVEALHLSCHGDIEQGEPILVLESPRGERAPASSLQLLNALGQQKPALVFLSACRTAEQPGMAGSLSLRLVRAGVANVIGWDGSVYDQDASDFAHAFYRELTSGSVPYAAAIARGELLRAQAGSKPYTRIGRDPKRRLSARRPLHDPGKARRRQDDTGQPDHLRSRRRGQPRSLRHRAW